MGRLIELPNGATVQQHVRRRDEFWFAVYATRRAFFVAALLAFITGCATTREPYTGAKFGKINLTVTQAMEQRMASTRFNAFALSRTLKDRLRAEGIYQEGAAATLNVVVDSARLRSAFNANALGMLSGSDVIGAKVTTTVPVHDRSEFPVVARILTSGHHKDERLHVLYDAFATEMVHAIKVGPRTYDPLSDREPEPEQQ